MMKPFASGFWEQHDLLLLTGMSVVALAAAMLTWPEFYLFSKFVMLPKWASTLPSPIRAGAYLATIALLPAAWGIRRLDRALLATFLVVMIAPLAPVAYYASTRIGADYFWSSLIVNYLFVLGLSLAKPALSLLALRWAAHIWLKLK